MNIELLSGITVLYVEDEQTLQEEIYQNISPFVKEVIRADDGKIGLEIFIEHRDKIDIIISDILMPNMTGIEMIDEIRKFDSEVPVIYTTAFNDTRYMQETIKQMIVAYILKPVDVELLLIAIEKASLKIENERLKLSLLNANAELEEEIELKTKELRLQNINLQSQLYTDNLTLLYNRKALRRDINKMDNPVLILIDVDSFKNINDMYGEFIGNLILIEISKLITTFKKDTNYTSYRIGSDEFTLLKDQHDTKEDCEDLIKQLSDDISSKPIKLPEHDIEVVINVTIGVSYYPKKVILETADMALKRAKLDRVPYLIYSEEYNTRKEHTSDIKWSKVVVNAVENNEVVPYYQPIVDKDNNILKYESLMRIVHDKEIYSPFYFLDVAKKVRFYAQLESMMVNKVLKKVKDSAIDVSINLSIQDILNKEFIECIYEELRQNNIAHLITFEILESENINDYARIIEFIVDAKKLGCKIAIDDFGSGFSNFEYLLKLKPDYLKIDGSLVKNIDKDSNSYLIVKTINEFAHGLGMKTVAEFVHSKEVFDILKELGVDGFQGYYLGKPLEALRD